MVSTGSTGQGGALIEVRDLERTFAVRRRTGRLARERIEVRAVRDLTFSIGAGETLVRSPSQPHWNRATTTPYAAPIVSRFMITALSGTSSDRNTAMSSRNDRASTARKK